MNNFELFEESISVLGTNRMRTALSMLGIVIGIGSVITLVSLGQASQASVKSRIQSLGSNLITIRPGAQQQGFLFGGPSSSTSLDYNDVIEINTSNRLTTVVDTAAEYSGRAQVSSQKSNTNTTVTGVTGNYFKLRNIEFSTGSGIENKNNENTSKIAVIGSTIAEDLYDSNESPIGQLININGQSFNVIGVTKSKGGNIDETVFIPLLTSQNIVFGVKHLSTIYVGAKSEELMEAAKNQVGFLLLESHKLKIPTEADFSISSQEDILETAQEITRTFTTLLTGIAAISLIVGGIGIMNIMLVTVTERTAEIGLRKALGAKRKSIIMQFLMESVVLTITGGIVGVLVGIGASYIITSYMSLENVLSWNSIGLAVAVASFIGIIFGLYPAVKASKLQPIEALRYE